MLFAARFAKPLRNSRLKISLLTLAVAAMLMPARAHAATCTTSGSVTTCVSSGTITISGTYGNGVPSSISVSGLSGTVSNISVTVSDMSITGNDGGGLNSLSIALVPPSAAGLTAFDFLGGTCNTGNGSTITLNDSGDTGVGETQGMVPADSGPTCSLSGTYLPVDYNANAVTCCGITEKFDNGGSSGPATFNTSGIGNSTCLADDDVTCGSYNFGTAFGLPISATNLNGTWTIYVANEDSTGKYTPSGTIGSWSIAFTTISATATSTSLTPTPSGLTSTVYTSGDVHGDSDTGTAVSLQATVTPNPGGGSVSFYDSTLSGGASGTAGAGTLLGTGSVNSSTGKASISYTFTPAQEGLRTLSASFTGTTGYAASTSSLTDEVTVNHTYNPSTGTYCNGTVTMNDNGGGGAGAAGYPYPSQLIVTGATGTIESVTATLNGLQVEDPDFVGFMLQAPNGNAFEFMSWADGVGPGGNPSAPSLTNATVWLADGGSGLLQSNPQDETTPESCSSGAPCKPADDYVEVDPFNDNFPTPSSPFTAPASVGKAYPTGSSTFTSEFGGGAANGTWLLYSNNWLSETASNNSTYPYGVVSSWCLNFTMQANADATGTTVTANPNPASITSGTTASVTFTATVKDSSNSGTTVNAGTVTFVDGSTTLGSHAVSNGTAAVTASLAEGTHQVVASYSGTNSGTPEFGISNATLDLRVDTATTSSGTGAGPFSFCNSGSIVAPATNYDYGAALPYPSNVFVAGLPGTVKATTVTLNDFTTRDQGDLMSLLVGPGGTSGEFNLDFFSLTGSNVGTAPAAFNLTFQDSGAAITTNLTGGGPYEPSSKNTTPIKYPQCAQNATLCGTQNVGPPLGSSSTFTPSNEATSAGSAIFGDAGHSGVFGGDTGSTYNGNGTWSLYIDDGGTTGEGEDTSITGGWCVNLTVNLPSIGFNGQSASTFTQGGTGSLPAIVITNNGIGGNGEVGPIGDPTQTTANAMKVVDVLPTGLTFTNSNGSTDWNCAAAGQTVTCTNEDSVAVNASYSDLTLKVSVSGTASGNIGNNTVSVSDPESANTPGQAVAAITVDAPPSITSASSTTFTEGTAGSFSITSTPGFPTTTATLAVSNVSNAIPGVNVPSSGTGSISITGTPTASGVETFTITATNGAGLTSTQNFTLTVNQAPSITSASSTTFVVGTAGSFSITSTPGFPTTAATLAVSNVSNAIPGVNLPSSGTGSINIGGTPTGSGVETFTITATNGAGLTATQNFTLTVDQAPAFTSASSATMTVGSSTPFTFLTTGYPTATLSYSGTLPSGIGFTAKTGGSATLTGTPAAGTGGSYPLTITATGSTVVNQSFTLTVNQAPSITSASSTNFEESLAGSFSITSSPGYPTNAATLAVSNVQNAIAGVNLPSSGTGSINITGTPTASGTETFTVTATNSASLTSTQNFTLTVAPLVEISPPYFSAGCPIFIEYSPASCTFTASGGFGWVNVDITNVQNLISGLYFSYSGESVILSGTPTATGTLYFRLTATDSLGGSFAYDYSLTVQIPQYQLITAANPAAGGTVTPVSGGFYNQGTVVPITATPATGYTFVGWTSAADPVASATSASTTITVNNAESVTANFTPTLVVNTAVDDAGNAGNCSAQATPGTNTIDAACSLRDALLFAAAAGSGSITFDGTAFAASNSAAANTIALTNSTLNIPSNTTITGPTSGSGYSLANLVTVSGNSLYTVFTLNGGATASIAGLTIANGSATVGGAGVRSPSGGTLKLTNCTFLNNSVASGNGYGGAIHTSSTVLTIANSTFEGNSSNIQGGALYLSGPGAVTITNSTFFNNSAPNGGAIIVEGSVVTIDNSTISGNRSTQYGGALENVGTVTVTNSIVSDNISGSGGALENDPTYTLNANYNVYYNNLYITTESDCSGCTTNTNFVETAANPVAPLASNGGPTQTMLPLPGSAAICAGLLSNDTALGITTDQRGFGFVSTYCPSGSVDAGAVQTNYALAFSGTFLPLYSVNEAMYPQVEVALTESGVAATAATNTVSVSDSAHVLTGTTSASLSAGLATFGNLIFPVAETNDILTASMSLNATPTPPLVLTAQSPEFNVDVPAMLTYPTASTLGGIDQLFTWNAGSATQYELRIGSTGVGSSNLYNGPYTTSTSVTVSHLPSNGETVYVRLFSLTGGVWLCGDYTFAAFTGSAATLNPLSGGSTLSGPSQLFTWSSGVGVTQYELRVGSTGAGSSNLYNGPYTTNTSVTLNGLPRNGETIYVRLFSLTGGFWLYNDYTFNAFTATAATLTNPTTSTLSGASQLFTWLPGGGDTEYELRVGSTGVGSSNLYNGPYTTNTSTTVSHLPTNGETIYVRLSSFTGGLWLDIDYTFTAYIPPPS